MKDLIIGHRGFVGSNLSILIPEAQGAGRVEMEALEGETFRRIYCAAPQAKKWWANQNPIEDLRQVNAVIAACRKINCSEGFYLLSTIDVYDPPVGATEHTKPAQDSHPYGKHRHLQEQALLAHFGAKLRILRLPALVGRGLKKNIIYDLIHDNNVERINPNSSFQWFNLVHLENVLELASKLTDSPYLNVVSEPLPTPSLVERWFPQKLSLLDWQAQTIGYDVKTIHAPSGAKYLYPADVVMDHHLRPYIENSELQ